MTSDGSQKTKILAVLLVTVLIVGAVLPLSILMTNLWSPEAAIIPGDPVNDTIFSEVVGDSATAHLSDAYSLTSERPLVLSQQYVAGSNDLALGESQALVNARNFLSQVVPSIENWTLHYTIELESPPGWEFHFTYPDFVAYVIVDAINGRVVEYESSYLNEYDPTALAEDDAEQIGLEFLNDFDYSVPETARFFGGDWYDCRRFYTMTFYEFVGPARIDDSFIRLRVSSFSYGLSYFKYNWVGLETLDLAGILSPGTAQESTRLSIGSAASQYLDSGELSNFTITETELVLSRLSPVADRTNNSYRLAWVIGVEAMNGDDDYDAMVYVDPFSVSVFAVQDSVGPYRSLSEYPVYLSPVVLVSASITSVVFLVLVSAFFIKHEYLQK